MLSIFKTVLKGLILTAAGVLLFGLDTAVLASPVKAGEYGIIASGLLNIRPKPSNTVPPIGVLKKGTRVAVLGRDDGWLRISHGKKTGYIRNRRRYVHLFKEGAEKSGVKRKVKPTAERQVRQQAEKKAGPETVNGAKSESERIGRKIERQKAEVARFGREEEIIINGLDEIDLSLNRARGRIAAVKEEMAALDARIAEIKNQSLSLEKEMAADEKYVGQRLTALYKLKLMGKLNLLASADTLHGFAVRKRAMENILALDALLLERQMKKMAGLVELGTEMEKKKGEKAALEEARREEARIISVEKRKREKLLSDIRSRKALGEAAVASLLKRAKELDEVTARMAAAPSSHIKAGKQYKRLLRLPVKGKIISTFGPSKDSRFDVVTFQSGINIRSDRGEPVQAVMAGKVLYASWFKGYGNMIIIDHGDSYYTLYAHAQELFKKNGESVEEREVIATVGETGSMDGVKLHFEVRHHGKPIDPLKWLKNG